MKNRKEYYQKYNKEVRTKLKDVHIYLTQQEYDFFKQTAEKQEIKVSKLIKTMALSQAGKTFYLPKEIQEELSEFVFLIRNIANNVNQIARHSNTVKTLVDENGLLSYLKDLETTVKDYVKNKVK